MGFTTATFDDACDYGLHLLDGLLKQSGRSLGDFESMPQPSHDWAHVTTNTLIAEQLDYNCASERDAAAVALQSICDNAEQHAALAAIVDCIHTHRPGSFFVNGPGGTGKTFLYKAISHILRADAKIVLCSASSGIAAILLPGGRTAHSTFKIPIINLCETSTCSISKSTKRAELLIAADLII
ncbi:PIF1-like helicase-domain-containing protein, partial [Schizophyllum amplum]